ncbi:MAG: TonB-dependent receptor plug domain-containing protein [bacterium]
MEIEFTSLFKRPETLFDSPAAAYIITNEDMKRSGNLDVPGALRMVPGMQVAQHDAGSWAITSRGFSGVSRGISGQFANKLLVLMDGRSVYTPLFSGVSWETLEQLLDDIHSIEIIRGPGATLWGANAVNGIINILSKSCMDTQGGLFSFGLGTERLGFGHFRYGAGIGNNAYYRVYAKFQKVDSLVDEAGIKTSDDWHIFRSGFRIDWDVANNENLTVQGDIYSGKIGQRFNIVDSNVPPYQNKFDFDSGISGGNVLGRWKRSFSNFSELALQVYYDLVKRREPVVNGTIQTFDVDFQHRFFWGERQEIIWGAGWRFIADKFDSNFTFHLRPDSRQFNLYSAFIQDEISLVRDRLRLFLGTKIEHNAFTGLELQPSLRLHWKPEERHSLWGAVSHAVRSPSRGEHDVELLLEATIPESLTIFTKLIGNRNYQSENMLAFELGYRVQPGDDIALDLTAFHNRYFNLRSDEPGVVFRDHIGRVLPVIIKNNLKGETNGFEMALNWQVRDHWRLMAAYSYLNMQLHRPNNSIDSFRESMEGQSPRHQFFVRSMFDVGRRINFDIILRFVDELPMQEVDSYLTADLSFNWKLNESLIFSVVGQNLLQKHHAENSQILNIANRVAVSGTEASEVQRSVFSKITWQF